ncbi:MAG: hypothetical protein AB8G15_11455 [Saprospiraceae bacterium]
MLDAAGQKALVFKKREVTESNFGVLMLSWKEEAQYRKATGATFEF